MFVFQMFIFEIKKMEMGVDKFNRTHNASSMDVIKLLQSIRQNIYL